jgi:DNA-binding transcriptional MocR family regulator
MYVSSEIINAVKETKSDLAQPKSKAPYTKKITKRILHAIGNGLRTSTSIANALGVDKAKIQSNLHHIKARGLVYSSKQEGKLEHKYHLTTEKPVLGTLNLDKPKRKYTKRKSSYNKDGVNTSNSFNTPPRAELTPLAKNLQAYVKELEIKLAEKSGRLNAIELTLIEKEKEVWTLECEVFDKKAIIKYLEEKLFQLGVRV